MKRLLLALTLASVISWIANPANADTCICAKVPMYPYGGTGNWLHYSMQCTTGPNGCNDQFPTSWVGPPVSGQRCTGMNSCAGCSVVLGAGEDLPDAEDETDLHYPGDRPAYTALEDRDDFIDFLKTHGGGATEYDDLDFARPFGLARPIALRLTRIIDGQEEVFWAIVWRIRDEDAGLPIGQKIHAQSFVGFEINGPPPPGVQKASPQERPGGPPGQCNATRAVWDDEGHVEHVPVPGLLQVRFSKGNSVLHDYTAFVRLNLESDEGAVYPACQP